MNYNNGPAQPGYAPSNVGSNPLPPNPGYAPSQASSPPPGMGGPYQDQQYNQNTHPVNQQNCLSRNNPFEKANGVTDDVYFNAAYKKVMGVALVSIAATFIGGLVVGTSGCLFINFAPVLHFIPIFMPSCNRFAVPFQWSLISMTSIVLTAVSLFFGLIQGCAAEAGIVALVIIAIELLAIYFLHRMDPTLRDKVKYCFSSCGCCGSEAQMQTMVPRDTTYNTQNPPAGGVTNYGYEGQGFAPQTGGLGPGSYVGDRTGGANAYQAPGSVASGYSGYNQPAAPVPVNMQIGQQAAQPPGSVVSGYSRTSGSGPPSPIPNYQSDTLRSSGKGGFMIDAPDEYEGGSRTGY